MGIDAWFRKVKHEFMPRVLEFAGEPITYVEIGCWMGASAMRVASEVLTHPESHGYGIDPYEELTKGMVECAVVKHTGERMEQVVMKTAHEQLTKAVGDRDNWTWIRERSQYALSHWQYGDIDLLYIDGLHNTMTVVSDFCLAWPFLKEGSGVIFDDYKLGSERGVGSVPEAITAIDIAWGNLLTPWGDNHISHQAYFKVRKKFIDEEWANAQRGRRHWLKRLREQHAHE